ncbi:hypothetical protein OSB04_006159 [Centaurea solstitialis]|uniref:Uncharacterized protein n=1 Tax=Centaurea solstitialis TaxID=347529 RepID=A0AA38THE3_9ASTR|nr:hypothetical protein OSB04_006159 [Centaurea solstitialis]
MNAFVNDLRRLGVEKSKYEVNVKFLNNLTQEWQNMAINIQLSRNLGAMGLHDLFSMMVQHEEFITGGRTKKAVDPLALSAVPFGGPSTAPVQPMPYNSVSPQYYPEEYSQEFNPNYGTSVQHPDEPVIISISDDELFHVNESLALISHSVQRLNANLGYNRGRGSGFPSGGRMGQGRGGRYQPERGQYGSQGRGSYQQGGIQAYDQGGYRNNQGRFREDQGRYKDQPRRDNTYLDYQGGQGSQGDWRRQVSDINYRNSLRQYTPESGYIDRQGYEIGYGGSYESGRLDQGPGYGYEQNRGDQRQDGANSQQLSRIVTLLSHTMASLHHLYTVVYLVVYLVVTVVVLLLLWAVWRKHASKKRGPGLQDYDIQLSKIPIYCDNTSAIAIANNPVLHSKTKHIEVRYHFIRDHVMNGDIELHFVPTEYQLADLFTKPLDVTRFNMLLSELGMLNPEE